jgi:hypothetical protein
MKKIEKKRQQALSSISGDKINFELMAQRWRPADDQVDPIFLKGALDRFAQIEQDARTSTSILELEDLIEDAESQGIASSYLCPAGEIRDEGIRAIDNLELWGIPRKSVDKLRKTFLERLESSTNAPQIGRAALHAVFIEVDEWSDYIDEYETTMRHYTFWLFIAAFALLFLGGTSLYFAHSYSLLVWFSLIFSGAAGSSASVLAKVPSLDVSLSGELDAYGRRIWSRIAVGTIGSMIGTAFLVWGIVPLAIKGQTLTEILDACSSIRAAPAPMNEILVLLGVGMLLGFSERTLTSFEQDLFGRRSGKSAKEK